MSRSLLTAPSLLVIFQIVNAPLRPGLGIHFLKAARAWRHMGVQGWAGVGLGSCNTAHAASHVLRSVQHPPG